MIKFSQRKVSERVLIVSFVISLISMALPWTSIGMISRSGIQQAQFVLYLFTAYPLLHVLTRKKVSIFLGVAGQAMTIAYMHAHYAVSQVQVFGHTINTFGTGAWLFLLHLGLNLVALYFLARKR